MGSESTDLSRTRGHIMNVSTYKCASIVSQSNEIKYITLYRISIVFLFVTPFVVTINKQVSLIEILDIPTVKKQYQVSLIFSPRLFIPVSYFPHLCLFDVCICNLVKCLVWMQICTVLHLVECWPSGFRPWNKGIAC